MNLHNSPGQMMGNEVYMCVCWVGGGGGGVGGVGGVNTSRSGRPPARCG